MAAITKDTLIGDILDLDPSSASFFMEMGMLCVSCPAARGETLEQACMVHAIDPDEIVQKLNERLTAASKK
jgi:hybrid cluster-associated redox disulfide protein